MNTIENPIPNLSKWTFPKEIELIIMWIGLLQHFCLFFSLKWDASGSWAIRRDLEDNEEVH